MSKQIITTQTGESAKSKLLKRYEKLINDLQRKKQQHDNITEGMHIAIPKIKTELEPLSNTKTEWYIKKLNRLDEVFGEVVTPKMKGQMFVDYMIEELEGLLNDSHKNDEQLKALYKKYAKREFKANRIQYELLAEMIHRSTGLMVDPDEIMEKGFKQFMFENQENFAERGNEKKAKPKKQSKAQILEEEENKILALDAKAIYFRLIKKYHPDLQQDPAKQIEYTEISKLVTKAYKDNDFMALLQLQITYLDESESDATTLADDMLKRYNKILQVQLGELNITIAMAKRSSAGMFESFFDLDYKFSQARFDLKKKEIEHSIYNIKQNLEISYEQKKGWFKACLKDMKGLEKNDYLFG